MKLWLKPHPTTVQTALIAMRAYADRLDQGLLGLSFRCAGAMNEVVWPGGAPSGWERWNRADNLWRHTCFEVFGRADQKPGYFEANFATSGTWATYGFHDYRDGMRSVDDIELIRANWRIRERQAELHAIVRVPEAYWAKTWRLNLSAVIENTDGTKSYWALAHPPGKPDFHHPDCFTLALPPPLTP